MPRHKSHDRSNTSRKNRVRRHLARRRPSSSNNNSTNDAQRDHLQVPSSSQPRRPSQTRPSSKTRPTSNERTARPSRSHRRSKKTSSKHALDDQHTSRKRRRTSLTTYATLQSPTPAPEAGVGPVAATAAAPAPISSIGTSKSPKAHRSREKRMKKRLLSQAGHSKRRAVKFSRIVGGLLAPLTYGRSRKRLPGPLGPGVTQNYAVPAMQARQLRLSRVPPITVTAPSDNGEGAGT
ncbi:hypothetical protein F4677DRAFT_32394 [Hypoxylon crocopeplum]|nr:hypothetical protein F4677DRAFT_32394 [Hypoxylon crocopeplum]